MSHLNWDPPPVQGSAAMSLWVTVNGHRLPEETELGSRTTSSWSWIRNTTSWSSTVPHFSTNIHSALCPIYKWRSSEVNPSVPALPSSIKSVSRALSWAGRRPGFWQQRGSGCARTPSHHADSSASLFPPVAICFSCLILRLQICCEASHCLPSCSHSTYQQHGMLGPEQGS